MKDCRQKYQSILCNCIFVIKVHCSFFLGSLTVRNRVGNDGTSIDDERLSFSAEVQTNVIKHYYCIRFFVQIIRNTLLQVQNNKNCCLTVIVYEVEKKKAIFICIRRFLNFNGRLAVNFPNSKLTFLIPLFDISAHSSVCVNSTLKYKLREKKEKIAD